MYLTNDVREKITMDALQYGGAARCACDCALTARVPALRQPGSGARMVDLCKRADDVRIETTHADWCHERWLPRALLRVRPVSRYGPVVVAAALNALMLAFLGWFSTGTPPQPEIAFLWRTADSAVAGYVLGAVVLLLLAVRAADYFVSEHPVYVRVQLHAHRVANSRVHRALGGRPLAVPFVLYVFANWRPLYHLLLLLCSVMGLAYSPLYFSVVMFDVIFLATPMHSVVASLWRNVKPLATLVRVRVATLGVLVTSAAPPPRAPAGGSSCCCACSCSASPRSTTACTRTC